ncbi:protein 44 [Spizellomyces punctatus DAOM BR117]|uniref:Mitochondrial pyruvate carrier n=1 Tax=Spizellomyces punctatus (strain DAOM BR117) TaxID=645134 RepID=A0A0L0HHU8_SPIPD|nr:protein 44 [Spizellomyces punctatus DAOM BR117]KND00662.1 protein 44 [Spizellomyces punctatus DAOM BR117]|eukprot:XP_016608701.1 protein 44 [Spizellomyces punctatus DAOM BR117]
MAAASAHTGSAFARFWNHPAGPKTIHFWAPAMKWGLVIAGLGDLQRPAEKLSVMQTVALAATGVIWSRYSLVITPKNWSLFSVNVFVGATGLYQLYRIYDYRQSLKNAPLTTQAKTIANAAQDTAAQAKDKVENVLKNK